MAAAVAKGEVEVEAKLDTEADEVKLPLERKLHSKLLAPPVPWIPTIGSAGSGDSLSFNCADRLVCRDVARAFWAVPAPFIAPAAATSTDAGAPTQAPLAARLSFRASSFGGSNGGASPMTPTTGSGG